MSEGMPEGYTTTKFVLWLTLAFTLGMLAGLLVGFWVDSNL